MINVENDYEPIIYEQPIYSHIYQNHDEFLLNYYTRPIPKNTTKENIQKTVEVTEKNSTECSNTNTIYQNIPKETQLQKRKDMDNLISFTKFKIQTIANTRP